MQALAGHRVLGTCHSTGKYAKPTIVSGGPARIGRVTRASQVVSAVDEDASASKLRADQELEDARARAAWEVVVLEARQLKLRADVEREEAASKARVERAKALLVKSEKEAADAKAQAEYLQAAAAAAKADYAAR